MSVPKNATSTMAAALSEVSVYQDTYFLSNGRYCQAVFWYDRNPADGAAPSVDGARSPIGQVESWIDMCDIPKDSDINLAVHVKESPGNIHSWYMEAKYKYDGVVYSKTIDGKNSSDLVRDWSQIEKGIV